MVFNFFILSHVYLFKDGEKLLSPTPFGHMELGVRMHLRWPGSNNAQNKKDHR